MYCSAETKPKSTIIIPHHRQHAIKKIGWLVKETQAKKVSTFDDTEKMVASVCTPFEAELMELGEQVAFTLMAILN